MILSSINILKFTRNSLVFNTSLRTLLIIHGSIKFPQGLSFIPDSNKPEPAIYVSSVGSLCVSTHDLCFRAKKKIDAIITYDLHFQVLRSNMVVSQLRAHKYMTW